MRLVSFASIVFILALSGVASAQTAAERAACQNDFKKYCHGVAPGGGRIIACLAKQQDKLSPECQKVVAAHNQ